MDEKAERRHINEQTLKLIVGVIALLLASVTSTLADIGSGSPRTLTSISQAWHEGLWARDFLVGSLFAIAAFLLAYNGDSLVEALLAKLAAAAAMGVALFPCGCGRSTEIIPYVHYISAAVMFSVLAIYCGIFFRNARAANRKQANWRSYIYAACGTVIVAAMIVLVADFLLDEAISRRVPRLVFIGEAAALVAFGWSWLVASRLLPFISAPDERWTSRGRQSRH